jgi:isocitrate dehydrogenase (NAD+)
MIYAVTLIPGDGIGPELADAARAVLGATGIGFDWDVQEAGEATIASEGTPLPDRVIESIRTNGVALKGPITTPVGSGFRSVNVGLRQALELYANVRPARTMKGVETRYEGVDLIIVRENTEDLYASTGSGPTRRRASRSSPAPPRSGSRGTPSSTRCATGDAR